MEVLSANGLYIVRLKVLKFPFLTPPPNMYRQIWEKMKRQFPVNICKLGLDYLVL